MIAKLRFKFIAVSMLSLFFVLFSIMGIVNLLNYQNIVQQADSVLAILKENDGKFPQKFEKKHGPNKHTDKLNSSELPYESRYFSVLLSKEDTILSVDTGKIAAVDTETAMEYAQTIYRSKKTEGFIKTYRYLRYEKEDSTRIIFLDCTRNLSTFHNFLLSSFGIAIFGLIAVFLLITVFSKRIIRPVIESHTKQKQFITDAGHELKTPITIISADIDVLEMDLGKNEWIEDIRLQTKRLTSLTNDLILLSRMEESKPQFNMIELPFSDLVFETSQSFQSLSMAQQKHLNIEIQPMLSIIGDEKTLRQLITILLDNALKYSTEQGTITLSLNQQTKFICLTVENTISPSNSIEPDRLFDRFYRGDESRNSQTGGYGLGLSIAKAIIDSHKGKVRVTKKENSILSIKILFPRVKG